MKKNTSKYITWILAILFFSSIITGCRYYNYKKPSNPNLSNYISNQNPSFLLTNHFIIHTGDEMMEMKNVKVEKSTNKISGQLIPFYGIQRKYYDELVARDYRMTQRKRGAKERSAVKQFHFYVDKELVQKEMIDDLETVVINFDDISKIEILKNATGTNTLIVLVAGTAAFVTVVGIIIAATCNCPHVYVYNGESYEFTSSLFTGAIAPQLERHDYKILPDYFKDSLDFEIKVINEENENQYTNLLELRAIYHDENIEVVPDKTGKLHTISHPQLPASALDNSLNNVLENISAQDDHSYNFDADSLSELSELFVTFQKPTETFNGKLILKLKNSQWSGYVYDEFSSLFGKRYKYWVKKNKNKSKEDREKWMKEQGINLLVDVKTDDGWKNVEVVEIMGDINYNSIVIPMEFSNEKKNVEIRVRSAFMFWELDYLGMDYSEDMELDVQRLKPIFAQSNKGEDFVAQLNSDDSSYMNHLGSGSSTTIKFEPIKKQTGKKRTLILHSKGYYTFIKKYSGKPQKKELAKFSNPGELSRFSKDLYEGFFGDVVIEE